MGRYYRIICLLTAFALAATTVTAQQSEQKIITETKYLLYQPPGYNEDTLKKWPLVLFLHGSGESGDDLNKVKKNGPPELIEQGKQYPALVVSPQSDVPSGWDIDQLYKLLQQVKKKHRVDPDRVYVTGLSMGGFGAWAIAMKYPQEFAAIAPICGGGDTTNAWKMRHIPIWNFHGTLDKNVPIEGSINMVKAASRFNEHVSFTIYPDKAHNSWDTTYNTNDTVFNWLLKHRRFAFHETTEKEENLVKLTGKYISTNNDTVRIIYHNRQLKALPGKDSVVLRSYQTNQFFLRPDRLMDIRFVTDRGNATGFYFFGDRNIYYRREN
jgi:dienelactone hydrolase